ncbi:Uncharacterised protein [Mycobacteroides abscessus subsp. abscessus]|nr:Uncharacterised protein [Mycobacteroides abscessus subsp. abscessus]
MLPRVFRGCDARIGQSLVDVLCDADVTPVTEDGERLPVTPTRPRA